MERIYLCYLSQAASNLTDKDLLNILSEARGFNFGQSVTGMLLLQKGYFFQVIEGDRKTILDLFELIKQDQRHTQVELIKTGKLEGTCFEDWAMGLCELERISSETVALNEFLNQEAVYDNLKDKAGPSGLLLKEFLELRRKITPRIVT
ncbi:MAG: BLUF domain-containing protein [Lentisphaeria bacterium]|nr:BLUF domain-containing protein [Lentisphaeria bacterium]